MAQERLQKIIARAGVASRREAEEMIRAGRVTINGKVETELGTKAEPERDHIKVDGKLITRPETLRYILLNKPKQVMTTTDDPEGRETVLDLIKGVRERIFPVGRLDYHSEGLLILTNDGDLAYTITHPSQGSVKTYHVKVRGIPEERILDKLRRGITIDGRRTMPCEIERLPSPGRKKSDGSSWVEVRLREGRTQQIRNMFRTMGHPVQKLRRVAIGPITDAALDVGQSRELTPEEVELLRRGVEPPPRRKSARPTKTRGTTTKGTTRDGSGSARKSKTSPAGSKKARKSEPARTAARKPAAKRGSSSRGASKKPSGGRRGGRN